MALTRSPTSRIVNGAYFRVKDPDDTIGLFKDYVTFPGLGGFTMPAETGGTTEVVGLDGPVSAPQFKGVGTITGSIIAKSQHPVHRFLSDRAVDGKPIQIAIHDPAKAVTDFMVKAAVAAGTGRFLKTAFADAPGKIKSILAGHYILAGAAAVGTDPVAGYDDAPAAGNAGSWRAVLAVTDGATAVTVVPGFVAEVAANTKAWVRNPGATWEDITCTVSQFDSGDYQAGGVINSNFTFVPAAAVPTDSVEMRTGKELGGAFTQ